MVKKLPYILTLIVLAGIVTVVNLGFKYNFLGEDSGVIYDFPQTLSKVTYYMWDHFAAPGKINVTSTFNFLWLNFIFLLYKIGLNALEIKRILYFVFYASSGVGAYMLVHLLLTIYTKAKENLIGLAAFIGSLIYMFNHFSMELGSIPINPYHISYMVLPWLMYFLITNLQVKNTLQSLLLFALSATLIISSNPSNTLSICLFALFYCLFFYREIKKTNTRPVLFIFLALGLILLLSSYIGLTMFTVENPYGFSGSTSDVIASLDIHSKFTSFYNVFRLAGAADWASYSYNNVFENNPIFKSLGYVMILLVTLTMLSKKYLKIKLFFLLVILVSLFFAKGAHVPLANLYTILFKKFYFFGIYRASYAKFIYFVALSFSFFAGIFVILAKDFISKYKNRFLNYAIFLIPVAILIYNYPFFFGHLPHKDYLTVIPKEYQQASNILKSDATQFKVLSLPMAPRGSGLLLQWEGGKYIGPHPDASFLDQPVLDAYWYIYKGYSGLLPEDSWYGTKFERKINKLLNTSGFLNIKYIILHKDFLDKYHFGTSQIVKMDGRIKSKFLEKELAKNYQVKKIADNKYFNIYQLGDKYLYPKIYIAETIIASSDPIKYIFTNYIDNAPDGKVAVVNPTDVIQTIDVPKKLTFKYIDPTRYKVIIHDATKPFLLVFSETFHEKWLLSVPSVKHFEANGYANGWIIDPKMITNGSKTLEFELIFKSQEYFQKGLTIALSTLILTLTIILLKSVARPIKK